jgi:1-acyl-sn-glycerol-3-phosphate acyltransferase
LIFLTDKSMIRATIAYLFIAIYIIVLSPVAILYTCISGKTNVLYTLGRFCIRAAGLICGVRVKVQGLERIAPGMHYVFLSNHQGNFDGPVLIHLLPRDVKAMIKKEMMGIPILSWVMKKAQFVPIERTNPKKARSAIQFGAHLLTEGNSFIAFPEGTRSRDGHLGPFKKGVFIMAIIAQAPIVPITIKNSAAVQPPGQYGIKPGQIDVIVHEPIPTEGMNLDDRDRLIHSTRAAIASAMRVKDVRPEA